MRVINDRRQAPRVSVGKDDLVELKPSALEAVAVKGWRPETSAPAGDDDVTVARAVTGSGPSPQAVHHGVPIEVRTGDTEVMSVPGERGLEQRPAAESVDVCGEQARIRSALGPVTFDDSWGDDEPDTARFHRAAEAAGLHRVDAPAAPREAIAGGAEPEPLEPVADTLARPISEVPGDLGPEPAFHDDQEPTVVAWATGSSTAYEFDQAAWERRRVYPEEHVDTVVGPPRRGDERHELEREVARGGASRDFTLGPDAEIGDGAPELTVVAPVPDAPARRSPVVTGDTVVADQAVEPA